MSKDIVKLYFLEYFNISNELFKPYLVSLQIIYQKKHITSSKLPLYCTQTVCNYYSSCIVSLLLIRYAEKELSIIFIKVTLKTNSLNSDLFSFSKKSENSYQIKDLRRVTRSFLVYKIYLE